MAQERRHDGVEGRRCDGRASRGGGVGLGGERQEMEEGPAGGSALGWGGIGERETGNGRISF